MTRTEAATLVTAATCTWSCLLARELVCICRCDGQYHGHCPRKPRYRVQVDGALKWWMLEAQSGNRFPASAEEQARARDVFRRMAATQYDHWRVAA